MRLSPFTRFALLLPAVMLIGATAFAVVSYNEARKVMVTEFHAALREEITALETIYQLQGHKALAGVIAARAKANRPGNENSVAVYLLTDAKGAKLAGNLNAWPPNVKVQDESSVQFVDPISEDIIVAVVFLLYEDQRLLVGRRAIFEHVGDHLWRNYALLVGAVLLVSSVGGWAFTRALRRRLGRIRLAVERIRHGHLDERIPLTRSRDEIEGLVVQLNDMLDQLEALMQHARATSSAIAHDLRHPISRLRNGLESLAADARDPQLGDRINSLTDEIDTILRTFQAVLRLGRLEAGAYPLQLETLDTAIVAEDAASLYEPIADEQGRRLLVRSKPSFRPVDRELLFQAVANLLENALRHGAGDIELTIDEHGIAVRDHGPGIPPDDVEQVQEPFVRLDESRSEPGSGLGLSLVKASIEAHGGTLVLENADPGLRVHLQFPLSSSQASTKA